MRRGRMELRLGDRGDDWKTRSTHLGDLLDLCRDVILDVLLPLLLGLLRMCQRKRNQLVVRGDLSGGEDTDGRGDIFHVNISRDSWPNRHRSESGKLGLRGERKRKRKKTPPPSLISATHATKPPTIQQLSPPVLRPYHSHPADEHHV